MSRLFLLITVFAYSNLHGQTYVRQTSESTDVFIKRIFKVDALAHPVIETKEWDPLKKVILCFLRYTKTTRYENETGEETYIVGHVLVPTAPNTYKQILIDSFMEDYGGEPIIETVFFVNADKDKEREIAIMVSYKSIHKGADIDGIYYETHIYDNPNLLDPAPKLKYFEKLSNQFYCFEGDAQGKVNKCRYKDFKEVRIKLKQLGF